MTEFPTFERVDPPLDVILPHLIAMGENPQDHLKEYWSDYCGLGRHFAPRRILEIGVRFGYTAYCLAWSSPKFHEYVGLDNECYVPGSNELAKTWLENMIPNGDFDIRYCDTREGIQVNIGYFDFIHIDGDHTYEGALDDLRLCWSFLRPGGVVVVDDWSFPDIRCAVEQFLAEASSIAAFGTRINAQQHAYFLKEEG